ncbi:MAG: MarC family protein [Candidatus ainarchaeum sp.]|nr:MarC family protein [Candidatus ainarchaeum sp.]
MIDQLVAVVSAFIYVFVIVDPLASLPLFISLTEKMKVSEMRKAARDAVIIAGIVAVVFLLAGTHILDLMKIDIGSFRVAGGLVLGLLGLETVLGFHTTQEKNDDKNAVVTLIATPMLTGPGLITALIVMSAEEGLAVPFVAMVLALLASWIIFDRAIAIKKFLGHRTLDIFAKVFGLFLVAMGVSFIKAGLGV